MIALLTTTVVQLVSRRTRSDRLATIDRLVESASKQAKSAAFGLALVDLDTAIELTTNLDSMDQGRLQEIRKTRARTALQDAEQMLTALCSQDPRLDDPGEWLTLRARVTRDPDLASIRSVMEEKFRTHLEQRIEAAYQDAGNAQSMGRFPESHAACRRVSAEIKALPPDDAERWRTRFDGLLLAIARRAGVVVSTEGSQSILGNDQPPLYLPRLVATVSDSLTARGYVPAPTNPTLQTPWREAPYSFRLAVIERRDGNYLGTSNRLTRIEVRMSLSYAGTPFWESTAIARSSVPVPNISAPMAARVAISQNRIKELEDLLYEDARSKLDERVAISLRNLPDFPTQR